MGKHARLRAVEQAANPQQSIELDNAFLENQTVFMAIGDLYKAYVSHDTAYKLNKLSRNLNSQQKSVAAKMEAIIGKYTNHDANGKPIRKMEQQKDEKGELVTAPDGTPKMIPVDFDWKKVTSQNLEGKDIEEDGEELAKIEFANLKEEKFTIEVYKFARSEFQGAKLTTAQWMSLNPLFSDPYVEMEAKEETEE